MKKNEHKKEKTSLLQRLREEDNTLFLETMIEIHNTSCMYVSGCEKIKDYNSDCIKLACHGGSIVINGKCLRVEGLVNSQVSISGKISGVEFPDD